MTTNNKPQTWAHVKKQFEAVPDDYPVYSVEIKHLKGAIKMTDCMERGEPTTLRKWRKWARSLYKGD